MRYLTFIFILTHSFAVLSNPPAHNGSIIGQVLEPGTDMALTGAFIRLSPGDITTTTNNLGYFSFTGLGSGTYTISVICIGFEPFMQSDITVRDAESTTLKFALKTKAIELADIEIKAISTQHPAQLISALDIRTRPVINSQEVLRLVPGLFIAQHAGGGKAEQFFLRGFDIDHGTDLSINVDGMPVNMVSHAHGQGYADLHFLIPELIDRIDYQKGPYDIKAGNFATAGNIRFKTVDALENSYLKCQLGQFNTARTVGAFKLPTQRDKQAYLAGETYFTDGYFESQQAFKRFNFVGKYTSNINDNERITLLGSAFQSSWDASGQIPNRAIDSGAITRFGAIDNTEGGQTARYNLAVDYAKNIGLNKLITNKLYYINYNFELYSNFTFFLTDSINGDQIRQRENRQILGYEGTFTTNAKWGEWNLNTLSGLIFRHDRVQDNELSRTANRVNTLSRLALGDVDETNAGAYTSITGTNKNGWYINLGIRTDLFQFQYLDGLDTTYNPQFIRDMVWSPKLNVRYQFLPNLQVYSSAGYGFHSNDTRVLLAQSAKQNLPKALGFDLGVQWKPSTAILANFTIWRLDSDQEFVYVGDEGVVEPGGHTRRLGADLTVRAQIYRQLFFDTDLTISKGTAIDEPEGSDFIPLAPRFTATGGLGWEPSIGYFGSLRYRILGNRPANESNNLTAEGYCLFDGVIGWRSKKVELGVTIQNLTNAPWKEAQFETESRLKNEDEPISEIHFTPGTPFNLNGYLIFRF